MRFGDHPVLMQFRRRLAHVDAVPQLSLLALLCGIVTGLLMVAFRLAVEVPLATLLPAGDDEAFESLPRAFWFVLPTLGGLLVGLAFERLKPERRQVGVVHVMERLTRHQGHLPLGNGLAQFLGGVAALASGQAGGREGPAVHLGAAASSLLGQSLRLPNNSIRTLVGCGTAAAISASFDTPLAGVVFAMEVVMMEYTVVSFVPVIIAAVAAAVVAAGVYGQDVAFTVPDLEMTSLLEVPFVAAGGFAIGAAAALFSVITTTTAARATFPVWARFTVAGALTGAAGLFVPEVLGVGYDSVDRALIGELGFAALLAIGLVKLVVSATAAGLGMPVGIIGPALVVGAMLGGALGTVGQSIWPAQASAPGFYVILGMGAMMGALLQAPLAALMAVLELTANPNVTLPAMLAIVVASLTSAQLFRRPSLFQSALALRGLQLDADPVTLALQRAGVGSRMERRVTRSKRRVTLEDARTLLASDARWVIIDTRNGPTHVLAAADLQRYVTGVEDGSIDPAADPASSIGAVSPEDEPEAGEARAARVSLDLLGIPGLRKDVVLLQFQATLHEAMTRLAESGREAVCVTRTSAPGITSIIGVLTREDIDQHYRLQH